MTNIINSETRDQNFWEKHLAQWRESGSSQAEYCRNNKLKEHIFSYQKCKSINKAAPKSDASAGFIQVKLPPNSIELATLSLRFNSGTSLSGITASNLALVKQLVAVLA